MSEPTRNLLALLAALVIGFALGAFLTSRRQVEPETIVITKTDTLVRVDTLHHPYPVPKYVRVVDSIPYPVPVPGTSDTVFASLPREEKVYEDSTYRAVVSGYLPSLDAIDVYRREVIINNETLIRERYRKRWSLTVGPQVGIGYTPKGWQPYAGAGLTFGYSF